jgi:hypothetical protein
MRYEDFPAAFERIVGPVVRAHGFRRVREPDGWMAPRLLFVCDNRWVGASWDSRDRYLEVQLGRLFEFRDVMPSAIVLGFNLLDGLDFGQTSGDPEGSLAHAAKRLPEVLASFEDHLAARIRRYVSLEPGADASTRRALAEFRTRLGGEITFAEWSGASVDQGAAS